MEVGILEWTKFNYFVLGMNFGRLYFLLNDKDILKTLRDLTMSLLMS